MYYSSNSDNYILVVQLKTVAVAKEGGGQEEEGDAVMAEEVAAMASGKPALHLLTQCVGR